ncbi:MAG: Crp/Fnr family transcriptional regulator [Clostridia bacterium]|nr:Crp/Fnr family transcriptional regulator [Clostridia bacterium]
MILEDDVKKIFDETKLPPKKILNELMLGGKKILLNKGENFYPEEDGDYIFVKRGIINVYFLSEDWQNSAIAYRIGRNKSSYLSINLAYIAKTNVEIMYFSKDVLNKAFLNNQVQEYYLMKNQAEIFYEIINNVNSMYFGSVEKKIATYLMKEYETLKRNKKIDPNDENVVIKTTHETIAQNIGSAREVVSRKLAEIQDSGIVELARGRIIILDKESLKKYTSNKGKIR